jgi:hypothetical protein
MSTPTQTPLAGVVEYPGSDGQPMSDNTLQFEWIVTIKEGPPCGGSAPTVNRSSRIWNCTRPGSPTGNGPRCSGRWGSTPASPNDLFHFQRCIG